MSEYEFGQRWGNLVERKRKMSQDTSRIVRCKMQLVERKESSYWGKNQVGLTFRVVTGEVGDEAQKAEDKRFHEATPSGQLEFQTVNWQAAEGIEIGQKVYVDIIKAD